MRELEIKEEEEEKKKRLREKEMATGVEVDALATVAECAPVTFERKVKTDLESYLPKPCMFLPASSSSSLLFIYVINFAYSLLESPWFFMMECWKKCMLVCYTWHVES